MDIDQLARTIRQKHRREISALHHELFGEDGTLSKQTIDNENRKTPRIGPVASLTERFTKLTIVADMADLAFLDQNPSLEGTCVTVSIAGHHRVMDSRVPVNIAEAKAWIRVVLGDKWAPHAYQQGTLSGVGGRATTMYFRLFLDAGYRPCTRPDKFGGPELVPAGISHTGQ